MYSSSTRWTARPYPAALLPTHAHLRTSLTKESVIGIIAWIILGLGAGLIANMLIPGRRQHSLIITCLIGIAGALLGDWAAAQIFHIHNLQRFFNASTWLTAIAGAAVLLLAYHLFTRRSGGSRSGRSRSRSGRRYARR
jgi:uncharacterized membrane protein YeaQ/YmgE (transglycosylase-associated protein family)